MKKCLFFIIIIILIAAISFWLIFLPTESFSKKEVIFSVGKGEGSKDIALNLEKENLIRWAPAFKIYVLIKGIAGDLKAGEYILSPSMNIPGITEKFVKGETAKINITIPEGFTVKQIEERLGLKLPGENLEGFLFPDTYQFPLKVSGEEVVKRMRDNFEKKMTQELREEVEKQGKSIFEIVIMASILEKEVRTLENKKIVSGIFWKKISRGEPLYSCATIAYILGRENWTFDEMREEIASGKDIDSPYNTYKYQGLPLGPISNPGLESIMAAIYPEESDYRYYLSTPEGETHFSETLEEHNIKKEKYFK